MTNKYLDVINREQTKSDLTPFKVGDSIRVHTIVKEGDKERVQIFTGIVIARRGSMINESFTVRRISYGEGVERVFPLHSPRIAKIEVETAGTARRAKLYYLRNRSGKSAMAVREKKGPFKSAGSKVAARKAASAAAAAASSKGKRSESSEPVADAAET